MANKEGKIPVCFLVVLSPPQSLSGYHSVKGCFYARNVQWERNPLVNHSLLLLFWQTAFTSAWICWGHPALPPGPGERGMRATEHLSLGHRVPKSPLPTNLLTRLDVGFQSFCHCPQTQGRVTNETKHHVCHRDRRSDSSVSVEMQKSNWSILLCRKRN